MTELFFPPGFFPEGHFPDGHFPEEAGAPIGTRYTVPMAGGYIPVKYIADSLLLRFDWTDVLPDAVTLVSVVHNVSLPLTKGTESTNTGDNTSDLDLGGGAHGVLSLVECVATLSDASTLTISWPIRCMNA